MNDNKRKPNKTAQQQLINVTNNMQQISEKEKKRRHPHTTTYN